MTANTATKSKVLSTEAAASWNTRYQTPEGFVCQITLRGETGMELLEKANSAITWLQENGFQPGESFGFRKSNSVSSTPANGNGSDPALCPIHNTQMKKWEKDGKVWYSHKTDAGWCTGKSK